MTTTFDTSGAVVATAGTEFRVGRARHGALRWDTLSPFTQGYIEALFASCPRSEDGRAALPWPPKGSGRLWVTGFSDLAPETLARIIADCEAIMAAKPALYDQIHDGKMVWRNRQAGFGGGFEPLTVQLGDDGKVRFATPQTPEG